jgi:Tol biopolymer transport system component
MTRSLLSPSAGSQAHDSDPSWSADGSRIAFSRAFADPGSDGGHFPADIYVINLDQTGLVQVTNLPSNDVYPVWIR